MMSDGGRVDENQRDPEAMLRRVREEEARAARGRLKIWFGAGPGVGKTYAMLEDAQRRRAAGEDVVVGWVETHGRSETARLLDGLELLPARELTHRAITLREFDLDAALSRRPGLLLLDELAHSNAPGSRHAKRWQDVNELRAAGIAVHTTMNVQHLESLNDVVAQITDVRVRETVPDQVFEQADDIELVDLPPDELLRRLSDGKVYLGPVAERAAEHFFRPGNLIALRELALRRSADRVDRQVQRWKQDNAIDRTWSVRERVLVCVGPNPMSGRLVRSARRLADALRAEWIAAFVENPGALRPTDPAREVVERSIRLAEQLGAETVVLSGTSVSDEILRYARSRNVTKLVVGKPERPRWKDLLFGSPVDELVRKSGDIDVYVIRGHEDSGEAGHPLELRPSSLPGAYLGAVLVVAVVTGVDFLLARWLAPTNLIMLYLVGVVVVAARLGRGPSLLATFLSVAAFDFCFVPPRFTMAVSDSEYLITFAVMTAVSLVISTLVTRGQRQAVDARAREWRTAALYRLSRELARGLDLEDLARVAADRIGEVFDGAVVLFLPDQDGQLVPRGGAVPPAMEEPSERAVAHWAYDLEQSAGLGTATLPGAKAMYVPLVGTEGTVGVLAIQPKDPKRLLAPEQMHLLETFANQAALAFERASLARRAEESRVGEESERMRNSLLSSVSHDLRTPLSAIAGAASALLDPGAGLPAGARDDLARGILEGSNRLNRLLEHLLDMTRLETGVRLSKEWHSIEELVGSALGRVEPSERAASIEVHLPDDLPLVPCDGVLIEQVLVNLFENALRHTPDGSAIAVEAGVAEGQLRLEVNDRGPGLPSAAVERVFEKFFRVSETASQGSGLGLAICRAIVAAHGGTIAAENRHGGGATFRIVLPLAAPPEIHPVEGRDGTA
jgi:two-component system sensor histidine kinase KdpD